MKKVCLLCVLLALFSAGCAEEKSNESTEGTIMQTKVNAIRLVDPVENMYDDPLNILLDDEETQNLLDALDEAEKVEADLIGYFYYSLELVDAEDNVISKITIDASGMLKLDSGEVYERVGTLDEVLSTVEQHYNISTAIWRRVPGENYFGLSQLADNGLLLEFTENNFIEGKRIQLTSEECGKLSAILQNSVISKTESGSYTKKYSLELYTDAGASVCLLYADSDFNVYTQRGYPIENDALSDYLQDLLSD